MPPDRAPSRAFYTIRSTFSLVPGNYRRGSWEGRRTQCSVCVSYIREPCHHDNSPFPHLLLSRWDSRKPAGTAWGPRNYSVSRTGLRVLRNSLDLVQNKGPIINRVFSRPVAWPVVTMETVGQTNQRTVTTGAQALSAHYIMLIRPLQALPLVRIHRKLYFQIYFLNARHAFILMWNTSGKRKKIIEFF